ncbi:MAG TPA: T9SS type A sorting domain-containing protein [Candidatus Cloacimonetes bacterium]|nr:T9SS type A sorting domain-containing protein [Candidatus Cloacimonadota bacterium]
MKRLTLILLLIISFCLYADWTEQQKILASDGTEDDYFGYSVSINGDYAVIGAFYDGENGDGSGSAYIFQRNGTNWTEQAKLTASDGAAYDEFGRSVCIDGDYVVIGAYGDDDNGFMSGSAYIFWRNGSNWSEQAKLTASDGDDWDRFGYSVSISGDYAVIGAYRDDDNGDESGSAYIFQRNGGSWTEQAKLTASDGDAGDWFGRSVFIDEDYALIGVEEDEDNGEESGSAYIFHRNDSSWTEQAKLTASDGAADDHFGESVSIDGDYALIGAYGDYDNGMNSGSAYIFQRNSSSWIEQDKLTASDGAAHDDFGFSVSINGDYAVIGAHGDDDNGSVSGSAYIFKRNGSSWIEQDKLTASDGAAHDVFGFSVSINGDYAVIGAHCNDDNGEYSGSAYIFINDGLAIDEITGNAIINTSMAGNFPNPFNAMTNIEFNIRKETSAILTIYNMKGQTLERAVFGKGHHIYEWNAENCCSGVYYYTLESGNYSETKKMILLK